MGFGNVIRETVLGRLILVQGRKQIEKVHECMR